MPDNLTISIGADTSKLRADLTIAQQRLKQFGSELRAAAAEAARTGDRRPVDELSRAYEGARGQVSRLTRELKGANQEIVETGHAAQMAGRHLAAMNDHVGRLGNSFAAMGSRMRQWGTIGAAAVGGVAVALGALTKSAAVSLDSLDDLAKATGTSTQQIEALQLVATKAGDQGFDAINKALERTTKAMGEAQITGDKSGGDALFKALDIDVTRFRDPIALMEAFARKLDQESNAAIKAARAAEMWGKSWASVLPTVTNLRAGMRQATQDIAATGGFTSQRSIDQANKFLEVWGRLEALFRRIRDAAGAQLGAALTPAIEQLTAFVGANIDKISEWIVNAATYIRALSADLIRFFVLGQPGQDTEWGAAIINTILYIKDRLIPGVTAAFQTLMGFFDGIAARINAIFGTNLTGGEVAMAAMILQVSGAFNTLVIAVGALGAILVPLLPLLGPTAGLIFLMTAAAAAVVTLTEQWGPLVDAVKNAVQLIGNSLSWLWGKLKELGSAFVNMPAPVGMSPAPMAAGGRVPGSGTGDTVPAWLTPGEFVTRKASVAKYGTGLFQALNSGAIPRGFFRGLGFALGGLVETPRGFAAGGLAMAGASSGRNVTLVFGSQSFPMSADDDVVDRLASSANRARMRSAGVKPSWYGGR